MVFNKIMRPSVGAGLLALGGCSEIQFNKLRQGSNERDSSHSTERSSPVILSVAKDLAADRDRPFAEFTLE